MRAMCVSMRSAFFCASILFTLCLTVPPFVLADDEKTQLVAAVSSPRPAAQPNAAPVTRAALLETLNRDPAMITTMARERYTSIRDYRCRLIKQERIDGKLRDIEEVDVLYREAPKSIFMKWVRNADQVKRALFVDDGKLVNSKGEKMAKIEPNGSVIRLFVKEVEMEIHGPRAREASRRTIDEFGFGSTLDLLDRYNKIGRERGVLDLRFEGEGVIDGRPTFVLVRRLPYDGPKGVYPEAKLVLHIDQEYLMPVGVYSYADNEGRELLGSYLFTQIQLNPGLTEADFRF